MSEATIAAPVPPVQSQTNGHHKAKSYGETIYDGPLENLPYPDMPPSTEDAVKSMYTDGYVILPGVLNRREAEEFRALIDGKGGDDAQYNVKGWCYNKHLPMKFHQDPTVLKYMDPDPLMAVVDAILGADCHVLSGGMWVTGAGRKMNIHADHIYVSLPEDIHNDPRVVIPIFSCSAHYYLKDMTAEMGPTTLIPGSHRAGRPPRDESTWNGQPPKAVIVKAGDVCLFRHELWHGAGSNTGQDGRRYMAQVVYGHATIATWTGYPSLRFKEYYSSEVLASLTPRQSRLLDPESGPKY